MSGSCSLPGVPLPALIAIVASCCACSCSRTSLENRWDIDRGPCGNGVLDPGEECDDGNTVDWDGCTGCVIGEFIVNANTARSQTEPSVAVAPGSSMVVVWQGDGPGYPARGIYGRVIGPDVSVSESDLEMSPSTDVFGYPDVSMASDGRFVVVWTSYGQDGELGGIFGQRFDPDGTPSGPEFQVNERWRSAQGMAEAAMTPDGRFTVVWQSDAVDGSYYGIVGQRFDADGRPRGLLPW